MFSLDDRLLALRRQTREWAADFRALALRLDSEPDAVAEFVGLPGAQFMATLLIPREYDPPAIPIEGHRFFGMAALERAVLMEELACGDAGVLMACPGPSMSGVLVDILGDEAQRQWYYERLLAEPTWTFFGLTEPESGSDAAAMRSALVPSGDGFRLTGSKRYVGNAARASLGVVFARRAPGPLGVSAVLVDASAPGFSAEPIDTIGLRALRISAVRLEDVEIPAERVLGRHLSATRRGIWASVQTFNRLRPAVAAVALGIARAAHEYVVAHRERPGKDERYRLDRLGHRIEAARQLVHFAAAAVDADRPGAGHIASAAKARACRLAEDVTTAACGFFGPGTRREHPLLGKFVRDARGVEFMEGTGTMQKLNLFHGFVSGKVQRGNPFGI